MKLLLIFALISAPHLQDADPDVIVDRVQNVYNQENCISSEFIQIYTSGTSGKAVEERGIVSIKKPGKMRWEYQKPDKKYYYSDGTTLWEHVVEDRQVTTWAIDTSDEEPAHIRFLMGRGNIEEDFTFKLTSEIEKLHHDSFLLRLVPKEEEPYDYLIIEINPRSYYIERFITFDPLGNTTELRFPNLVEDDLPDSFFTFEIPGGVEVIDGDAVEGD